MNYLEFRERIKQLPTMELLEYKTYPGWPMHPTMPVMIQSVLDKTAKEVKLPNKLPNRWGNMERIYSVYSTCFAGSDVEGVLLPHNLRELYSGSFAHCHKLQWVYIPKSIHKIEAATFLDCPSLCNIFYEGSLEEWHQVEIVHHKKEIEFGRLYPGRPVVEVVTERIVPIPGNEAVFMATVHTNFVEDFNR